MSSLHSKVAPATVEEKSKVTFALLLAVLTFRLGWVPRIVSPMTGARAGPPPGPGEAGCE